MLLLSTHSSGSLIASGWRSVLGEVVHTLTAKRPSALNTRVRILWSTSEYHCRTSRHSADSCARVPCTEYRPKSLSSSDRLLPSSITLWTFKSNSSTRTSAEIDPVGVPENTGAPQRIIRWIRPRLQLELHPSMQLQALPSELRNLSRYIDLQVSRAVAVAGA